MIEVHAYATPNSAKVPVLVETRPAGVRLVLTESAVVL